MRLTDPWFEAEFIGRMTATGWHRQGAQLEGAQGLLLYCPCCFGKDSGAHALVVSFANPQGAPAAPPEADPNPRWTMTGTGLEDLTLSPSVNAGCWHGWIQNGEVR